MGQVIEAAERFLNHDEAERLTQRIKLKLGTLADAYEAVMPLIREAVERKAHEALGYPNFTTYAVERFNGQLERLDIDVRRAVVRELEGAGLSQRAIAPIVGTSQQQVSRDLERVTHDVSVEPEHEDDALTGDVLEPSPPPPESAQKTGGLDGREYVKKPRKPKDEKKEEELQESKPRRKNLPSQVTVAGTNLRTSTERLEALINDDRFNHHKEELATQLRSHLDYTIRACASILERINN